MMSYIHDKDIEGKIRNIYKNNIGYPDVDKNKTLITIIYEKLTRLILESPHERS